MDQLPLMIGVTMGLASSLHCIGMCGPIACGIAMGGPAGASGADRLRLVLMAQGGKALSYVAGGALFGSFGVGLYDILNFEAGHAVLQWTAGLTLVWIGLSFAELVPALAGLDRVLAPVAGKVARLQKRGLLTQPGDAVLAGMVWGLMPCAMVYMALFNAVLAGSVLNAMQVMLGFALGTVPAVTASALGLNGLLRAGRDQRMRRWAGLGLAVAGIASLLFTAPGSPFCIWR